MSLIQHLSNLAFSPLVGGVVEAATGGIVNDKAISKVVDFLDRHFIDQSQRLTQALGRSNASAWKSVEIALAGESLWTWLDKAEAKAFREQVRAFLEAARLPDPAKEFRQACLTELRAARKGGHLEGPPDLGQLAQAAGGFARFADPEALLDAEWQAIALMAGECRDQGYASLARLLELRTDAKGTPLLVTSVRYFFRREIETDRELFQGLAWVKLELLQTTQDTRFSGLADALKECGDLVTRMLSSLQDVVVETHNRVVDVQAEVAETHGKVSEVKDEVLALAKRFDLLQRELRPRDSLCIGSEGERQLVKQVIARYRSLPEEQRQRLPDLLNAVGKLEVATGAFDAARRDFQQAALLTADERARAEAHHNAYNAALEQGDLGGALESLRQAYALDAGRFAPFPTGKYEPERILGAGGFGVAFLCRNRHSGSRVVVKALRQDTLDRTMADVFREAQVLEELEHAAVIRVRDCDYADSGQTRPYLVMDYFDGGTLGDHVEKVGPLAPDDLLALMHPVAEALQTAHARGILHRDVKPPNLLVRHDPAAKTWRVKLIDFGLALKQAVLATSVASSTQRSVMGYSIAGTLDYAAPEQMGKLPGAAVGPHTDVYGFAKTCCYALFRTTQPLRKHWREVPEGLADLLEQCLNEQPKDRLQNFGQVLERLAALTGKKPAAPPEKAPTPTPSDEVPTAEPLPDEQKPAWSKLGEQGAAQKLWSNLVEKVSNLTYPKVPETPTAKPVEDRPKPPPAVKSLPPKDRSKPPPLPAEEPLPAVLPVRVLDESSGEKQASPPRREWWKAGGEGNPAVGELRRLRGHTDGVYSVAFSPDGTRVVSGGADNTVRVWDAATGKEEACFQGHTDKVWNVLFTPDGRHVLSASKDKSVRLWDLSRRRELQCWPNRTNRWAALSPTGHLAVSGSTSDGMVRVWEPGTGREVRRLKGHMSWVLSVSFHVTGRYVLSSSADGTMRIWEVDTGREKSRFQGHKDQVWTAVFTPDGKRVLSCSADRTVRLWDLRGSQLACYDDYAEQVWSVAVTPDGRLGLSDGDQWTVRLWELDRGRKLPPLQGHGDRVVGVAVSPDSRLAASASLDKTVIVWGLPS